MKCTIVLYFVTMQFVLGMCFVNEYCEFYDTRSTLNPDGVVAGCGEPYTMKILDIIPPISNFVLYFYMFNQNIVRLPSNAFRNLSSQYNVSKIRLENCKIHYIDADAFLNLYNLSHLNLAANDIHYMDTMTFQQVTKLKHLYLDHNQIELLQKALFDNLSLLEIVTLSFNQIWHIAEATFRNKPLLRAINLAVNKLQYLDLSFKDNFLNDTMIILEHNPWNCDCNLIDLYDLYMRLPKRSAPICENPTAIRGRKWTDLTRTHLICNPRIVILYETKVVPIGKNIRLTCVVNNHDKPNITWRKGSTNIASDYLSSSSYKHKYFLNYTFDFEETDADLYYCDADFADGRQEVNITLTVYTNPKSQQINTAKSQPPSNRNSKEYKILAVELIYIVAILIGITILVRCQMPKSKRKRNVRTANKVKLRGTNARSIDNTFSMGVGRSSSGSESSDSESSTDDVD